MAAISPTNDLENFLRRGRNADGGWAYHAGKMTRLEPTCWGMLALAGGRSLHEWPVVDGLLLERAGGSANYAFHAIAILTMRALGVDHVDGMSSLLQGVQRVKGEKVAPSQINRQDNSLQGWSWIANTFSWVEPTAWCLLALKKFKATSGAAVDPARIEVAERLLVDRCCLEGGWNYGNSNMLGQELRGYVPTTAIALLALQDRRSLPEVERSIAFLERNATTETSGAALAMASIALTVLDRPAPVGLREALIAQVPTTITFGNQMSAAMSLYALQVHRNNNAFAL